MYNTGLKQKDQPVSRLEEEIVDFVLVERVTQFLVSEGGQSSRLAILLKNIEIIL